MSGADPSTSRPDADVRPPVTPSEWVWRYDGYDALNEPLREVLCAVGNGRFVTRAAAPECRAGGEHYPGTYAAGIFDRLADEVDGHRVENESIVNLPDWQSLTFRIDDGDWLDLGRVSVTEYVQELDLHRGVLTRRFLIEDDRGRLTRVAQRRLVSMADPFLAALDCSVRAENWSGVLTVRSGLDGRVSNSGVARYRGLNGAHLSIEYADACADDGTLRLVVRTVQSQVRVGLAARHGVICDGAPADVQPAPTDESGLVAVDIRVPLDRGGQATVEKLVALCTSRDPAVGEPGAGAVEALGRAPDFDEVLARHELEWNHLWHRCDVAIEGPPQTSLVLRLHLFHLLQTVSRHSIDLDVGIPARGLHGEAYRGHVFWDEIFVLPFLSLRLREVARAMLMYRWRRLAPARAAARAAGHRGAMYPWQSGATGREETQTLHLNPRSGHWLPDHSRLQRHVGLAIAYNTWRYVEATADTDFLRRYGAEMLLEIATFFADLATYDRVDDRFDICGVMGPDEYHDALPWRDAPGLDDNAYTNVMAAWTLARALDCLDLLEDRRRAELLENLGLDRADLERWGHVSRKLRLCWHPDPSGVPVLSQFRDYDRLEEFDWTAYSGRYGDISRLDRILEAEADTTNRYKVSKQADVLMLFQLLSADELYAVLDRLGYAHDRTTIPKTINYYLDRTSHGSTLSRVVHSWVLARSDRRRSWHLFLEALDSDVADVQGGTTPEGVHLGAMAGTVDLLQRGFTGLETRSDALGLDPFLPDALTGMRFRVRYRSHPELEVSITHDALTVGGSARQAAVMPLRVRDDAYQLDPRATLTVPLRRRADRR
jgi:trehalose/maltose hydrolase-like predicted phosphorylase